jgi:hypothetical protein
VIDGSLPDSGHRMSANFNVANDWSRPILLKNSLFKDDEKLLAHLTDLLFFDTRGYESHSKVRCGATGIARYKKRIGFPKCLVLGKKSRF